jgi:hypothetical protein
LRLRKSKTVDGVHLKTTPIVFSTDKVASWYDANRVQLHTRLGPVHPNPDLPDFYDTPEFERGSEGAASLGASVLTRHFKARDEDPWWPSHTPEFDDGFSYDDARDNAGIAVAANENIAQRMLDEAYANDVHLINYYWLSSEARLAAEHPEWICRLPNGTPITHPRRGVFLDLASPYANIIRDRIIELASMGAEAFYFDSFHMPEEGSWGGAFEELYVQETGQAAPLNAQSANYEDWLQFKARFLSNFFKQLVDDVGAQFPHVQWLISDPSLAGLMSSQTNSQLVEHGIAKGEFKFALRFDEDVFEDNPTLRKPADDIRMAMGLATLRAAGDGAAPHIWMAGFPDANHIEGFVAGNLTYGAIANADIPEDNLLVANNPPDKTTRETIQHAVDIGVKVSPYLAGTNPDKFAAVLFSESLRDDQAGTLNKYREAIAPILGMYESWRREHVPVDVVNDRQVATSLDWITQYKVIFVVDRSELTASQQANLTAFESAGGVVLENPATVDWTTEVGFQAGRSFALNSIDAIYQPRFEVSTSHSKVHIQAHVTDEASENFTLLMSNDYSFVGSLRSGATEFESPPPPIDDLKITIPFSTIADSANKDLVVVDVMTNTTLTATRTTTGWVVNVPEFAIFSALSLSFA